jgi:6-pyruvoyltetrahydropterin/6-carboxytetrahydropterin synthase
MFEISIRTSFASAHRLRGYEGVCENIHGHNWKVKVIVRTEIVNDIGIGIDFKLLKKATDEIISKLDHRDINTIEPFDRINPSSENIAKWLFEELSLKFKGQHVRVHKVDIKETDLYTASYFESNSS